MDKFGFYIGKRSEKHSGMEDFCDGSIKTDDGHSFKIHRVILSMNSEYFRALFLYTGRKQKEVDVLIPWFSGEAIGRILQYIYTREIVLDQYNIAELLMASDFFLLDDLLGKCQTFVTKELTLTNCVRLYVLGHLNRRLRTFYSCQRFLQINFGRLVEHPENGIGEIPLGLFKILLADNSLNISSDSCVCSAIEQWIGSHEDRLPAFADLLQLLRFHGDDEDLFRYSFKRDIVLKSGYFREIGFLEDLGKDQRITTSMLLDKLSAISLDAPNRSLRQPKRMYLIARNHSGSSNDIVNVYLTYDEDIFMRRKISRKQDFWPSCIVSVGRQAYIIDSWSGKGMVFDILEKTWTEMESMSWRRRYSIVSLGQYIYAVGGVLESFDEEVFSCVFERYDTHSHRWESLGFTSINVTAVVLGDQIYIVGEHPTFSVMVAERYDPASGIFMNVPAPEVTRNGFALISYKNLLFILGGNSDGVGSTSVEVCHPATGFWRKFDDLPYRYTSPNAATVDDKLVVYDNYRVFPPVYWDRKGRKWEDFSSPGFKSIEKYIFCPIEDTEAIAALKRENSHTDLKWKFLQ